ncbi:MAG: PD40 domain-containing protein [Candidatus Eisenbacteria bacterium]|nr:PD40 domain-containing protein [Candidatus Eisenbacteria bacterium]
MRLRAVLALFALGLGTALVAATVPGSADAKESAPSRADFAGGGAEEGGCGGHASEDGSERAYFGQAPPGPEPEVFAPGIVSDAGYRLHGFPTFSPDLKEVIWPIVPPAVLRSRFEDNGWTEPAPLGLPARGVQAPFFSPDGSRLWFQGVHESGRGSLDIMYVDWSDGLPGTLHLPGEPLNSAELQSQPTVSDDGTVCFAGFLAGVGFERGIYLFRETGDGYSEPELVGSDVNTEFIDAYPFLTRSGDCLLFASSRPSMEEDLHLRAVFADSSGEWCESVNVSDALGLAGSARFPAVSPDGRCLFFLSEGLIYWVDFGVVERLRP